MTDISALSRLFTPFRLRSLELRNRFVMSPMSRYASPEGVFSPDLMAYYARRAAHDVALVTSESAAIERPASFENPAIPRVYGDKALAAWREASHLVHARGGAMAAQLWHIGVWPPSGDYRPPAPFEGPSGLGGPDRAPIGVAMSDEDIADTIAAFAAAARNCRKAGVDLVELHGGHGFLIDQFFWDVTNRRTDKWGGATIGERTAFGREGIRAVRAAVGDEMPVTMRISQWRIDDYGRRLAPSPQVLEEWVAPLADAGVDLFHCSQRRFWEPEFEGSDLNFAGWVKKLTGAVTMTVGSVGLTNDLLGGMADGEVKPSSLDELERRFDRGDFDLVAVGRTLLSDPQWVHKVRTGSTDFHAFKVEDMARLW